MTLDIIGSRMPDSVADQMKPPADNTKTNYGANGYKGASSDTDLSNPTRSAMAVALDPNPKVTSAADLTRTLPPGNVPTAHGMTSRTADGGSPGGQIPATLGAPTYRMKDRRTP